MRKFLNNETSKRLVGGPFNTPRAELPTTLATTVAAVGGFPCTQDVLNHCSKVCGAPAFGSQSRLGLLPAIIAETLPSPAASKLVVSVKRKPDCKVPSRVTSEPT